MRKLLSTIAVVCFVLAGLSKVVEANDTTFDKFKPADDTYPMAPDEHAEMLRFQGNIYVYKLVGADGSCHGVAIANGDTRFYQRLEDIGCDPDVDHVSFAPSELDGYQMLNFYSKTVAVGRITIKAQE
jgi:hypothetical protein